MKAILTPLALGLLAAGLAAQTNSQKLTAKRGTVEAAISTKKTAKVNAGPITKPVYIYAMDKGSTRYEVAYAKLGVGLRHSWWGKYDRPGAWLYNYGRVYSPKKKGYAKAHDESFTWTYNTGKTLNGVVKVYFSGYYYGTGVSITAKFGKDTLTPSKPGRFYIKKEYKISGSKSLSYTFSMFGNTGTNNRAHFSGKLSFYFEPAVTAPRLKWGTAGVSCGNGRIGQTGTVALGSKDFKVTLGGAKNASTDYAVLLIGNSNSRFFFLKLPFAVGKTGCNLYTNIVGIKVAKMANGAAQVSYYIPKSGYWTRYFRPVYFQWVYKIKPTKTNNMGMVFSDYGSITKK